MGTVQAINPAQNLDQWFTKIFGQQTGYIYAATKTHDEDRKWAKRFFHWPNEKDFLITYYLENTATHDVYFCPSLFTRPTADHESITKELFYGTYWLWADFDYGDPPSSKKLAELNIPEPTIKVRSSEKNKQHWYWRLELFQTDPNVLEGVNRRLTYALEADLGGWDYQQSLRPPGTIHQESKKTVLLLSSNESYYSLAAFDNIPEPPSDAFLDIKLGTIPDSNAIAFKYAFPDDTAELFRKQVHELSIKDGKSRADRSEALMRLGYDFAEMGMSNEEIYSLLRNVDLRWKKFSSKNSDPERQYKNLLKIIRRARIKVPLTNPDDTIAEIPVFSHKKFLATHVEIDWLIENLIHKKGRVIVAGPPEVGKTQFSVWIGQHLALGKDVLKWHIPRRIKTLVFSMEMGHSELQMLVDGMDTNFTDEERDFLDQYMDYSPLGYSIPMDKPRGQAIFIALLEKFQPEVVIMDSLGVAIDDDIKSDVVVNKTFQFINAIVRAKYGCSTWWIHHMRKEQIGNKAPKKLADLYGSQYIGSNADTVIGLWPLSSGDIEVNYLKLRLAAKPKSFKIRRTNHC